ncbi:MULTISPECIES: precorrin-2 dehydrogenase/sirohydrochlorin ferrochelatase family protein [Anaerotruncus]|jgi:siroheme synthase-like protein|uniref:precorrin-2 dehydrogenase n=1 Tax=Anaerotruncus colihominis TaxID=169435 RepID=A0A845SVU7_9FIRM|nr:MULTISPECIES: NAD(P)-dependent oxidoreductase [Anaerotruncus]MCI8492076.1 NAD(P)-dependent oxidoreductase [Anaerotruncus sp.]MCR2024618.1 NAD(P)-dependent oxidoreductase [Anaerotruncus colihominis]NBI78135.1 NAD(P)-dependent oxidoreductase [Anaerotruncus colihominis]NDO39975.1 NAD(P)-dependent oxidoreductase [Anaerotruncus colihominis]
MTQNTPHFPLFVDLTGKRCVVVGGGPVAARRADILARFGAVITVVSPVWGGSAGNIQWLRRPYVPGDLDGAYLAVAATDNRDVNRQVGRDARALGIPVTVADCRDECTFFFPAVCEGGGAVAGVVSLEGNDHQRAAEAARAIRTALEGLD